MRQASKYHNQKTLVQGIAFDSRKEATRYQELLWMQQAGLIRNIELQPRYDLVVNGHKLGFYKADFRYEVGATGTVIVEDVKGMRTAVYMLIPQQIVWNAKKRGVLVTPVMSAYSSQECSRCHYTDRKNRPDQKTFFCKVCGFTTHADLNAATNLSRRIGDRALQGCRDRKAIKALLLKRHEQWQKQHGRTENQRVLRKKRGKVSTSGPSDL